MPRFFLLILFLFPFATSFSQTKEEKWSKAKIHFSPSLGMPRLASLGVETDHGVLKEGKWFVSAFSQEELRRIRSAGFSVDVLVPDVTADFLRRNENPGPEPVQSNFAAGFCNRIKTYKVPQNWNLGSMGGHLTYEEMLGHLDSMRARYPELISARFPIDSLQTHQNRYVWGVRLSDNPNQSEDGEPQALFSAIHHAREPVSMHQLVFFMWYLLENYGNNPEIKALVNSSELYFVPCLNPDGYIDNQTNFPNGGGMRRKNMAPLSNGGFGVDLNRNYGMNWGYDDFGSSPFEEWDTYRGPTAFSEPETRAMRAFCLKNKFKIAQNFHTYSNLIIYPWGFENLQCPDSTAFRFLTREMSKENNYRIGTCQEVLNYTANGSSDDYMYQEEPGKPKILAMTPEVGDWFWPQSNEIRDLCLETVHQNLTTVRALHPMLRVVDTTGLFLQAGTFPDPGPYRFRYQYTRIGVDDNPSASFSLILRAFGENAAGIPELSRQYSNLPLNKSFLDSLVFPENVAALFVPSRIGFELIVNNGLFETRDTVYHIGGQAGIWQRDFCDQLSNWTGNWVLSDENPFQGTHSLKSNAGIYPPNANLQITRRRPFDLSFNGEIQAAEMSFMTRFDLEQNFDYVKLSFSTDSGANWVNVCTDRTGFSSPFSDQAGVDPFGNDSIVPIWDGVVSSWRKEYIDLRDYIGKRLWMRFTLRSDDGGEFSGFSVDDIQIRTNWIQVSNLPLFTNTDGIRIYPNPGGRGSRLSLGGLQNLVKIQITNSLGQEVWKGHVLNPENVELPGDLPPGCYQVRISGNLEKTVQWLKTP
jgi:carboxypeptidase T